MTAPMPLPSTVQPERAHHALPVQASLARHHVRYLDPTGHTQHLALTTTWCPRRESDRSRFWQLLLRGIEQSGCKVLEVTTHTEQTLELEKGLAGAAKGLGEGFPS